MGFEYPLFSLFNSGILIFGTHRLCEMEGGVLNWSEQWGRKLNHEKEQRLVILGFESQSSLKVMIKEAGVGKA